MKIKECIEQGRYCLGKFIPTRQGQTDTCIRCLEMLEGQLPPYLEATNKKIWKN